MTVSLLPSPSEEQWPLTSCNTAPLTATAVSATLHPSMPHIVVEMDSCDTDKQSLLSFTYFDPLSAPHTQPPLPTLHNTTAATTVQPHCSTAALHIPLLLMAAFVLLLLCAVVALHSTNVSNFSSSSTVTSERHTVAGHSFHINAITVDPLHSTLSTGSRAGESGAEEGSKKRSAVTVEAERMLQMWRQYGTAGKPSSAQSTTEQPSTTASEVEAERVVPQQQHGSTEVRPLDDAVLQSLRWPTEDAAQRSQPSQLMSSDRGGSSKRFLRARRG